MNELDSEKESSFTKTYIRIEKLLTARKNKCLQEYNQHMKPENAEITSNIYLQILAIQFVMMVLATLCIIMSLILHFDHQRRTTSKAKHTILILTIIHIISIFMQTKCRINWLKQKKTTFLYWKQYTFAVCECLFLLPFPNFWMVGDVHFFNYATLDYQPIPVDSLLSVYLLIRTVYVLKFIVHSESYYGSRPDRLSRYYAVKISNFNAVRFLVNQKPVKSISTLYFISMLLLPLAMNLLQGPINYVFEDYYSCLYYFIISQSTVGYGDMYPVTIFGRIISMTMIIIGLFFTSIILIFIVEELKLTANQEDTHYLLGRLQTQSDMKKAIVKRIKQGYFVRKGLFEPEQRKKKLEELAITRLQNRRMIQTSLGSEPANMRRMIIKNFSQLHHLMKQFSDKHQFLNQFCSVLMQKAPDKKRFNLKRQSNVTRLYNLLMQKQDQVSSQEM